MRARLTKISAYSACMQNIELDIETVKKVLRIDGRAKKVTIEKISEVVCKEFGVTLDELQSSARNQKISGSRQIAIYLTRDMTKMSFVEIAKFFDKKHPTILFSYEKIKEEIKTDNELKDLIESLKIRVKN